MSVFLEISLLLILTSAVAMFMRVLKQPLVVGYIVAGILAGPYALGILNSQHELELFSKVGIVFLLFIVGLHLNPRVIREVGSVSLITGIGQVLFTSLVGFLITLALGVDRLAAMYVAIALTFSSTIIILKLLADKKDLQKLYAKIAVGFLLVQDIVATLILIGVTVFSQESTASVGYVLGMTLLKGVGLFAVLFAVHSLFVHRTMRFLAKSQELLFLFSLAWGTGLASLFAWAGFSIEIGALVAGVLLSTTPYADEVAARLKPLRDFFIIIFFLLLGSQLAIDNLSSLLLPALVLSAFVLIGNPIIVVILMNALGYNRKTGFMAGLTVAQISEFSLILASLGLSVGHLSQEVMSLVTLVGLITIAGSTYLILYAEKIFPYAQKVLQLLELIKRKRTQRGAVETDYSAVIFGFDRVGHHFAETLANQEEPFLVVDYNPHSIEKLAQLEIPHAYGDASDPEFLEDLPLRKPKIAVSTIPDYTTNKLILRFLLERNPQAQFIPIAQSTSEAQKLYEAGAAYVVMPHHLGAEFAAKMINRLKTEPDLYSIEREKHLKKIARQI